MIGSDDLYNRFFVNVEYISDYEQRDKNHKNGKKEKTYRSKDTAATAFHRRIRPCLHYNFLCACFNINSANIAFDVSILTGGAKITIHILALWNNPSIFLVELT